MMQLPRDTGRRKEIKKEGQKVIMKPHGQDESWNSSLKRTLYLLSLASVKEMLSSK